jgi:guanine deaminase
MPDISILHGNFICTPTPGQFKIDEDTFCILENGNIQDMTKTLPASLSSFPVIDLRPYIVIPAFSDVHVHAPHLPNAGIGLDEELLPWLNHYTFPLETKFAEMAFAERVYKMFIRKLWQCGTLHASVFATLHKKPTELLFSLFREAGLGAFIGKVNMDRNSIPGLTETTEESVAATEELIAESISSASDRVRYIMTPRFVPSTTERLMRKLGDLVEKYNLPVQSHLDENRNEVAWVKELHPQFQNYADVYDAFGLMPEGRTIMAHCIYLSDHEQELLREKKVLAAHCAMSNADLSSGIMPVRTYTQAGLRIALGSDVGGAEVFAMMRHITETIRVSKLYWVQHPESSPVTVPEAFYMATKASGTFFGKTGSFEPGYGFDALVIDDRSLDCGCSFSLNERLERFLYTGDDRQITVRYFKGKEVPEPFGTDVTR